MSLPFATSSTVYWKSVHVIATPSDHTASGEISYVIFSTGSVSNFGSPASTVPGSSTTLPSCTTERNAIGCVVNCAIHEPHCEPPHWPIQSKQSGSCSAPTTSVPPSGTGSLLVTGELPLLAALPEPELPHAATITESTLNRTNARRKRRAIRDLSGTSAGE